METVKKYTKIVKHNQNELNIFKNNGKNILWIASWMVLQLLIQLPSKTEKNLKNKKIGKHWKNRKNK